MQTDKPNGNGLPPKIKLSGSNGNGAAKEEPRKIVIKKPGEEASGAGGDRKAETSRVQLPPETAPPGKQDSARAEMPEQSPPPAQAAKKDTARIELPPAETPVEKKAAPGERDKKQTARIDIADILSQKDEAADEAQSVRPRGAEAVEVPAEEPSSAAPTASPAGMPKTIRIKRPGSIPRSPAPEAPARTEAPSAEPAKAEDEIAEDTTNAASKKTETARIEIPADEAPTEPSLTRRKTVRIKRPDSLKTGGGRALKIARPAEGETAPSLAGPLAKAQAEPEAGAVFAVLALAALFITAVLVYMLAAQLWPGLPFPGKLV